MVVAWMAVWLGLAAVYGRLSAQRTGASRGRDSQIDVGARRREAGHAHLGDGCTGVRLQDTHTRVTALQRLTHARAQALRHDDLDVDVLLREQRGHGALEIGPAVHRRHDHGQLRARVSHRHRPGPRAPRPARPDRAGSRPLRPATRRRGMRR